MIHYLKGDATDPKELPAIIVHVCNNVGGWGAGFVMALSKKWSKPEISYRTWKENHILGGVQIVKVEPEIYVANMIAQDGLKHKNDTRSVFIDYKALATTLCKVYTFAKSHNLSVHMPRIGCGLAGGKWEFVEPIIKEQLRDLEVYVYDFE